MSAIFDAIRGIVQLVLFVLAVILTVTAIRSGVWNGIALMAILTTLTLVATTHDRRKP